VFDVLPLNQGWGGIQTPRPFPESIPYRGVQLLFEVPYEVIRGRSDRLGEERGE
jgi:hypothetical protein